MRSDKEVQILKSRQIVLDVIKLCLEPPVVDLQTYTLARVKLELCETLLDEIRSQNSQKALK